MSIILGIHDGHDASAALLIDGRMVAAAQEDRFTGVKMECGYPRHAIAACLARAGLEVAQVDHVVLGSDEFNPVMSRVKREANFKVADYVIEQRNYWKPILVDHEPASYWDVFGNRPDFRYDESYPTGHLLRENLTAVELAEAAEIRRSAVASLLGAPLERTTTVLHEHCHIAYAYYASPLRDRVLALTAESWGDRSNGSVSVVCENGINMLATTAENNLGRVYRNITLLLGMTPFRDEYKVMGLAPYANDRERAKSYRVFADLMRLDGLNIVMNKQPGDLYYYFRDALEGHRFDGIAGAVQLLLEELARDWLRACLAETGLNQVVFAGGVAQNIKACKAMTELDGVRDFCVSPASGDTSLSMGACYRKAWELGRTRADDETIAPLDDIYLGPGVNDRAITAALGENDAASKYHIVEHVTNDELARRLAAGQILGRCCGSMEFGLRALGNRSILADPRNAAVVRRINDAIKYRDFWMPFTPTILAERADDYLFNPKQLRSPYMTLAFDTTPRAQVELQAALHPADLTIRPQILERARNPEYYDLIKCFERLTQVGALLNTSFNLHGHSIVLGPREALFTLDNSELDGVILNHVLVTRRAG